MPKRPQPAGASSDNSAVVSNGKRTQLSQRDFPSYSIEKSLLIARAIVDHYGGDSGEPTNIALAISWSPTGGSWRMLCGASVAYGFTEGGYNASEIKLTPRGSAIVRPHDELSSRPALFEALLAPTIMRAFVQKYNKGKFPAKEFAVNVLQGLGLPRERCAAAFELITENLTFLGALRDAPTGKILLLESTPHIPRSGQLSTFLGNERPAADGRAIFEEDDSPNVPLEPIARISEPPKNAIFIAHGRDHQAVEQLKKLLDQMGVKGVLAKDEAHAGRPISQKVADCMRECSAGIFIASGDDDAIDSEGNPVKRARQNVIYELGAASFAYGQRIVIFKEKGVEFPTDFSDLGYIEYEKGHLADKFAELIGELVKLKAVRIQAGG